MGVCHAVTAVEPAPLLTFMHRVRRTRDEGKLTSETVEKIEEMMFCGKIGHAYAILVTEITENIAEIVEKKKESEGLMRTEERKKEEEEKLQCQKCGYGIIEQDVAVLECGHILHRLCLREVVDAQMALEPISLECPICRASLGREDLALGFSKGEVDQIERKSQQSGDVVMHCPSLGCRFKGKWSVEQFFFCSECEKYYCLICCSELPADESSKYHLCRGATSEDEATYRKLCSGQEIKQCSQCGYWNEVTANHRIACICGLQCCTRCVQRVCRCERKTGLKPVDWLYSIIR